MKKREEQSIITTSCEINRDGYLIPTGSRGTIVAVYKEGEAYEGEFCDLPDNPVVTLYPKEII